MSMQLVVGGHYLSVGWGDLEWGLCWPGYSDELTFDVASHPSIFQKQAPVSLVWGGDLLWSGTLDEPVRGQKLRAAGLHRLGEDYAALDGSGNPTLNTDVAVPQAITRGLPWSWATGGAVAPPLDTDAPITISRLIDAQTEQYPGLDWGVLPSGVVVSQARTAPRLHIRPGGDGLGIAWDNYASTLIARYVDSTSHAYTTVTRSDATAEARWGYKEATLPTALNDGAEMTLAQAEAILDSKLAAGRSRPGWTQAIEVQYGAVLNDHMQPVDLATIKPYETIRVHGLTEDVGDLAGQSFVDMPLARIQHNKTDASAILTPVGLHDPMGDVLSGKTP